MNKYIATFFSHYDAMMFFNHVKETGAAAKLMPVPRRVSSSCGTCVYFDSEMELMSNGRIITKFLTLSQSEIEAIYIETASGYMEVWGSAEV